MPLDLFAAKRLSDQTQNECTHSFWSDFCPTRKSKIFPAGTPNIPCAPHASVLTALRHSGRAFTAHVAESAGVPKGLRPLTPRGALCPSTPYFYIILRRV